MNDAINKLLREKHHWERRILELGGPSYPVRISNSILSPCLYPTRLNTDPLHSIPQKLNPKDTDEESIVGPGGYIYFGAAKNLPGVRELLRSSGTLLSPLHLKSGAVCVFPSFSVAAALVCHVGIPLQIVCLVFILLDFVWTSMPQKSFNDAGYRLSYN